MAETAPLVSVVIPAFNAAGFISRTLDSVKAQTFRDYEIVVVDDGSSDNTKEVVTRYLQDNCLKGECIRQQNKKIAGARNTGIRAARGKYIALLDHDDLWYPRKLEKVLDAFQKNQPADLVSHDVNIVKDGRMVRAYRTGPPSRNMYEQLLFRDNCLTPSSSVFSREKALLVGGFSENPGYNTVEDYDFWLRLSRIAKFLFLPEVLGEYLIVEGGASHRVAYHHQNAEIVIRHHFRQTYGENPGWLVRLKMRRRMSVIYRSAANELMRQGDNSEILKQYIFKMLREYAFSSKNITRGLLWFLKCRLQIPLPNL